MKLLHENKSLCDITNTSGDFPWMSGHVDYTLFQPQYRQLFEFLTDEGQAGPPPFPPNLLDSETWQVDDDVSIRGIEIPAVYPDGMIMWRWR